MESKPLPAVDSNAVPLSTSPAVGQHVTHDGKVYTTIREGEAYILIPPNAKLCEDPTQKDLEQQSVFYNPIQQYNRDLSVLAIRVFGEDFVAANEKKSKRIWEKILAKRARKLQAQNENGVKRKVDEGEQDVERQGKRVKTDGGPNSAVKKPGTTNGEFESDPFGDLDLEDEDLLMAESILGLDKETDAHLGQESINEAKHAESKSDSLKNSHVPFKILDALSATGLRALRYAKEIPFVTSITANDLSADAVEAIKNNIKHNHLDRPKQIRVTTGNAVSHMSSYSGPDRPQSFSRKYTVIDLDPYGTAIPFLDSAVQATVNGGMLCVTCTDSSVFNSMGYLEKTFSQYGGLPMKGHFCYEAGLRLILHSIATSAAKYGIAIEPLLSLSIDYYARVFVRLRKAPIEVKMLAGKTMIIYTCDHGCGAWKTQYIGRNVFKEGKDGIHLSKISAAQGPTTTPDCEHCGSKMHLGGPMYGGPIHNPQFIRRILDIIPDLDSNIYGTLPRIKGMLTTALEETELYPSANSFDVKTEDEELTARRFARVPAGMVDHHPLFFQPSDLAKVLKVTAPSASMFKGALRHLGYKAERSHAYAGSIKTDAPWSVLWDIMKEHVRQNCNGQMGKLGTNNPGWHIWNKSRSSLSKDSNWEEVFVESEHELRVEKVNGVWKVFKKKTDANTESDSNPLPTLQPPDREVVFDEELGNKERYSGGLVRYQVNPRENWGPMSRAKG